MVVEAGRQSLGESCRTALERGAGEGRSTVSTTWTSVSTAASSGPPRVGTIVRGHPVRCTQPRSERPLAAMAPRADGARADDARADDARADNARADNARADGARADGARADDASQRIHASPYRSRSGHCSPRGAACTTRRARARGSTVSVSASRTFTMSSEVAHRGHRAREGLIDRARRARASPRSGRSTVVCAARPRGRRAVTPGVGAAAPPRTCPRRPCPRRPPNAWSVGRARSPPRRALPRRQRAQSVRRYRQRVRWAPSRGTDLPAPSAAGLRIETFAARSIRIRGWSSSKTRGEWSRRPRASGDGRRAPVARAKARLLDETRCSS